MLDNKKGSWCMYLQGICQEGDCSRCEIYLHRNDMNTERNLPALAVGEVQEV